ncbi:nitrate reductase accessory periplasmic protein NapD [Psychromonas sp. CNPT3]|uniref:chaperone NapD n=1 Tax=Psychromonas sp. CNPT3 TaxID=314282 RepID=UPI00006E4822|nr:chaperone NapD [Psychromonas sp. CNPT3]AGH81239.1 nitrate reductase accessory periplasmic protein NapD [Psychromonas sp. CNPT3]
MQQAELHISSLIVHMRPHKSESIKKSINAFCGAEVVSISEQGKGIVLLESSHQREIMEVIDNINDLDGVLNTGLVYHEFEKIEYEEEKSPESKEII